MVSLISCWWPPSWCQPTVDVFSKSISDAQLIKDPCVSLHSKSFIPELEKSTFSPLFTAFYKRLRCGAHVFRWWKKEVVWKDCTSSPYWGWCHWPRWLSYWETLSIVEQAQQVKAGFLSSRGDTQTESLYFHKTLHKWIVSGWDVLIIIPVVPGLSTFSLEICADASCIYT